MVAKNVSRGDFAIVFCCNSTEKRVRTARFAGVSAGLKALNLQCEAFRFFDGLTPKIELMTLSPSIEQR